MSDNIIQLNEDLIKQKLEKQHPSCPSSVSWNSGISDSIFLSHGLKQPEPSAHPRPGRWF